MTKPCVVFIYLRAGGEEIPMYIFLDQAQSIVGEKPAGFERWHEEWFSMVGGCYTQLGLVDYIARSLWNAYDELPEGLDEDAVRCLSEL